MSAHKIVDRAGVACGCEFTRDARGREEMSRFCIPHKKEQDMMAAAANGSAAERANLDLIGRQDD